VLAVSTLTDKARAAGIVITDIRLAVLAALEAAPEPLTAAAIVARTGQKYQAVTLFTKQLVRAGILVRRWPTGQSPPSGPPLYAVASDATAAPKQG
jgi:DNA-binding MarR family transcriptional regulator